MVKWLRKLGKSLMLPAVVLPAVDTLPGIGYWLCPTVMQGGEITGVIPVTGYLPTQAALASIDGAIIALLFTVGVAVGMSGGHDGIAGLAGFISWLMITHLFSSGVVQTLASIAPDSIRDMVFAKIQNVLTGITADMVSAIRYDKFKNTRLPDRLVPFSGKRYATIITALFSIIVAAISLFVWSIAFGGLTTLRRSVVKMGAVGAGIYVFLNRLLIPFGSHCALNNVFWFDIIGLGDLSYFQAGDTSANASWSLGMYMPGFFPCMTFGVLGVTLTTVHYAKDNKEKIAIGPVTSATLCALICSVIEPFGFGPIFPAPVLYVVYAILYGIFTYITALLDFCAGLSFSVEATDPLFSASLPAAAKTWLITPLGIAAFIIFYVVFHFMITKFNLRVPGREEDDDLDEVAVKSVNSNYTQVTKIVLEGFGGKENAVSVGNCITRLRSEIKDYTQVDEEKIKSVGIAGAIRLSKTSVQVIVGMQVQFVADEFKKLMK